MDQFDRAFAVAELDHSGLHRDSDSGAGLDGIQAVVIAQPNHLRNIVQIVNAAVCPQSPR